ncbi:MAG TPA: ABC transporter substrate-binding protein [Solirubrobacteraceae bacterium]|jgi:NitT/TauT family transport system substrate-binding protein|nr:ABC transporter substrate-binding protein [Solirubrobacteraceae bacterium]
MPDTERLSMAMYCTGCIPGYQLPCFAGETEDIFRRHALSIEILDPLPQAENIIAVAEGRNDLCLTSVAHFVKARAEDPELGARFVFMVARQSHMGAFVVRGRKDRDGHRIKKHRDLDGASVLGDPDSAFGREYTTLLGRLGLTPGPWVDVPYPDIMQALAEGKADVAADFVDLLPRFQAVADPLGVRIDVMPFHEAGIDIYGSGLVASTRMLRERPQTVRAAVAAFQEALLASQENPALGLEALIDHVPGADPGLVVAGWQAGSALIFDAETTALGTMNADKWRRTLEYHADAYGGPRDIDVDSVFDGSVLAGDDAHAALDVR